MPNRLLDAKTSKKIMLQAQLQREEEEEDEKPPRARSNGGGEKVPRLAYILKRRLNISKKEPPTPRPP
jgi:hypothetical protein